MRVALVVASLLVSVPAHAQCLKPNLEGQAAEGQLTVGRAQDANGRPERPYILRLSANTCLDAEPPDDPVKATRTIHIVPNEKLVSAFRRLAGKAVVVSGSPFGAHTAHHHAPIVMMVSEIRAR
jgi:Domain of unknown function (DUF4431)